MFSCYQLTDQQVAQNKLWIYRTVKDKAVHIQRASREHVEFNHDSLTRETCCLGPFSCQCPLFFFLFFFFFLLLPSEMNLQKKNPSEVSILPFSFSISAFRFYFCLIIFFPSRRNQLPMLGNSSSESNATSTRDLLGGRQPFPLQLCKRLREEGGNLKSHQMPEHNRCCEVDGGHAPVHT